jgi:hypothetical protein
VFIEIQRLLTLKSTKLKEVYRIYLEVLDENERDIVDCGWSNYRMSEKTLINLMEKRIKGEKIILPEGYEPWG